LSDGEAGRHQLAIKGGAMIRMFVGLLLVFSFSAIGQERSFGSWSAGLTSDKTGMYAATANDSGGILAEYSYFKNQICYWLIKTKIVC
jgi:hypothetical protein